MTDQPEQTGEWVFLEVMGHRSHYGLLTEVERFGSKMARIDIYGLGETEPRATHFYGGGSIFSMTHATEEACRQHVSRWEPKPAQLVYQPEPEYGIDTFDDEDVQALMDRDME